jgi:hypothetical protein
MARADFNQTLTEFAEFVGLKDKEIIKMIGVLSLLTTTEKGSIVGAINELSNLSQLYQVVVQVSTIVKQEIVLHSPLRK